MEHSDASTLLVDTEVTVIQFSTAGIWPSCLFLQGLHITNFTGQITFVLPIYAASLFRTP